MKPEMFLRLFSIFSTLGVFFRVPVFRAQRAAQVIGFNLTALSAVFQDEGVVLTPNHLL